MELRMIPYKPAEAPRFNYEELKAALMEKAAVYETIVYDESQVKAAKEDRANLNRLRKALNDERIRQERAYMEPFMGFKAQVNDIIAIIDRPLAAIDTQVKDFEERQRQEKSKKIAAVWDAFLQADKVPSAVVIADVMDKKWLNASVTEKTIEKEMAEKLERIAADLEVIRELPKYALEAEKVYMETHDLPKALRLAKRVEEAEKSIEAWEENLRKEEEAAKARIALDPYKDDKPEEPQRSWVSFRALMTVEEANALNTFFKYNGIVFEEIV